MPMDKRPLPRAGSSTPDAPDQLRAVTNAYARLTRRQEMITGLLNRVLSSGGRSLDPILTESMATLCAHTGADRAHIVRLDASGNSQLTHGHCLPTAPLLTSDDKPYWDGFVVKALPRLLTGSAETISKEDLVATGTVAELPVASTFVPVMEKGRFNGFLAIDTFSEKILFLPEELHLLQTLANAIGAALLQKRTNSNIMIAQDALRQERARLQATLSALPDLVIEVDDSGRFTAHHSHQNPLLKTTGDWLLGQAFDEALSPEIAKIGHDLLQTVAEQGRGESTPFLYDFGGGDKRWVQARAVRRAGMLDPSDKPTTLFVIRDITKEITQADEIRRLSEVAKRTQNLVIMSDRERRITWVNAAFENAMGYSLAEITGANASEILLPTDEQLKTRQEIDQQLLSGLPAKAHSSKMFGRNGRQFWVDADIQPTFDTNGKIGGFIWLLSDVTLRHEHELALAEAAAAAKASHQLLSSAVEALRDGFVVFAPDGRLVLCNEKYRQLFKGFETFIYPGVHRDTIFEKCVAIGAVLIPEGETVESVKNKVYGLTEGLGNYVLHFSDGRWIQAYNKRMSDGTWVGLRIDVTDLKEQEVRARADRETAMDAASDGMAISDADGALLYANPAFLSLFAVPGGVQSIGRHWKDIIAAEAAQIMVEKTNRAFASGETSWRGEFQLERQGAVLLIEMQISKCADGAFIWVLRDLTERQSSEDERTRMGEELHLAQRREVIGQLAAGLAHDFNNLIAAISGSALLIKEESTEESDSWSHATRILKSSERAEGMVRKLLALGARPNKRRRAELAPLITEAAEMLRPALPRTIKLNVVVDPAEDALAAVVEPTDILQVVLNLGVNARDALFTRRRNTAPLEVDLHLRRATRNDLTDFGLTHAGHIDPANDYACIILADSGDGIDAETAEQIFTPYFTTKGSRGTGLGLAIVSSITKSFGGAVTLTNSPSGGAEFHILLPIAKDGDEASAAPALPADAQFGNRTTTPKPGNARPLAGKSVLLVDDAEDVLAVLAVVLERAGAEVAPTSDPEAALEVLSESAADFDVVVTDFDMGGTTGAQLSRATHKLRPDLPVILVTALTDWKSRDQAHPESGDPSFFAVLGKPVSSETLVAAVHAAIESKG